MAWHDAEAAADTEAKAWRRPNLALDVAGGFCGRLLSG